MKSLTICTLPILVFLSALAPRGTAQAVIPPDDQAGYTKTSSAWIGNARKYLAKNKKCYMALMRFEDLHQATFFEANHMMPQTVACIEDLALSQGTIHEKSGCSLVWLDLNTGEYAHYGNVMYANLMTEKRCSSGGFEDLTKMKALRNLGPNKNYSPTVEEELFETKMDSTSGPRFHLMYAETSKVTDWFNARLKTQRANFAKEKEQKEAVKQKKKDQELNLKQKRNDPAFKKAEADGAKRKRDAVKAKNDAVEAETRALAEEDRAAQIAEHRKEQDVLKTVSDAGARNHKDCNDACSGHYSGERHGLLNDCLIYCNQNFHQ